MDESTELFNQIISSIPDLKDIELTEERREIAKNSLFALIDQWKQTPEYLKEYGLVCDTAEGVEPVQLCFDTAEGEVPIVVGVDPKWLIEKWGGFGEWAMKYLKT
jgi:hypothetical protein